MRGYGVHLSSRVCSRRESLLCGARLRNHCHPGYVFMQACRRCASLCILVHVRDDVGLSDVWSVERFSSQRVL